MISRAISFFQDTVEETAQRCYIVTKMFSMIEYGAAFFLFLIAKLFFQERDLETFLEAIFSWEI